VHVLFIIFCGFSKLLKRNCYINRFCNYGFLGFRTEVAEFSVLRECDAVSLGYLRFQKTQRSHIQAAKAPRISLELSRPEAETTSSHNVRSKLPSDTASYSRRGETSNFVTVKEILKKLKVKIRVTYLLAFPISSFLSYMSPQ
jgi:hypothetical protein